MLFPRDPPFSAARRRLQKRALNSRLSFPRVGKGRERRDLQNCRQTKPASTDETLGVAGFEDSQTRRRKSGESDPKCETNSVQFYVSSPRQHSKGELYFCQNPVFSAPFFEEYSQLSPDDIALVPPHANLKECWLFSEKKTSFEKHAWTNRRKQRRLPSAL